MTHLKQFVWFTLNATPVAICAATIAVHFVMEESWQFTGALLALCAAFSLSIGHAENYKISNLKTGRGWAQAFGTVVAVAAAWFFMVDANGGNLAETMSGLGKVIIAATILAMLIAAFCTVIKFNRSSR